MKTARLSKTKYIPALRFKWLTPMYDFFLNSTMPEKKIKQELIALANIQSNSKVLDFGCGTATLTIMIKQMYPEAKLTGIDVDAAILSKAVQKIKKNRLDIFLCDYDGGLLPFQNNTYDRILSCLVFHHLDTEKKQRSLNEISRVMIKNGQLYIADFGRSESWNQRTLFNIIRGLDGFKSTKANADGILPELILTAGFKNVRIIRCFKTVFGEVQIIRAYKI